MGYLITKENKNTVNILT